MRHGAVTTRTDRIGRAALITAASLVLAFLILPILAVVPLSLNPTAFLVFPTDGLSLRWYHVLFDSPAWVMAFRNSLIVATATMLIATPLGTLAAIGLSRMRGRAQPWLLALIGAPMVVPVVVVAVAFYLVFAPLGLTSSYTGLVIAHSVLAAPFVVIVVLASLHGFDFTLVRAGLSLGATPVAVLRRVMVPLIGPGVAAGAVFAFMASFDDAVVALFIAGPEQRTLPMQMFDGVREQISPAITAAATLLVIASALLLGTAELLRRRASRLTQQHR